MRIFPLLLAALVLTGVASADPVTYNNFAEFSAAASLLFHDDFESYDTGKQGTIMGTQGIKFTQIEPGTLDVSIPSDIENITKCVTNCLTVDGNEDFKIELTSGDTYTAIGFEVLTNQYLTPVVQVYGVSGLIMNYSVGAPDGLQPPNTLGFFGIISDQAITYVRYEAVNGAFQDTAVDNVYIGGAGTGAPEPGTVVLLGSAGLLGVLAVKRGLVAAQRG